MFSCKEEPKDYLTLHGKITEPNGTILTIEGNQFKKEIKLNEDGTFSDTLKVTDGFHGFSNQDARSFIYLKNGDNLELNFDTKDFPTSISFTGKGSITNNYLLQKIDYIKSNQLDNYKEIFKLDKPQFDAKVTIFSKEFISSSFIGGK